MQGGTGVHTECGCGGGDAHFQSHGGVSRAAHSCHPQPEFGGRGTAGRRDQCLPLHARPSRTHCSLQVSPPPPPPLHLHLTFSRHSIARPPHAEIPASLPHSLWPCLDQGVNPMGFAKAVQPWTGRSRVEWAARESPEQIVLRSMTGCLGVGQGRSMAGHVSPAERLPGLAFPCCR